MTPERFHALTGDAAAFPVTLHTKGGKTVVLRTPRTFLVSDDYPDLVMVTTPGKWVEFVEIDAIASVYNGRAAVAR